jgi:N-sulfoglucosamine sulfohydrolase
MQLPNILYLHSHDTGRYVQPYGHAIETPNLQRLAEGGVIFRKAFCANPTCSASRAALLTGQYPHVNGMIGLAHRGFGLVDYEKHIVHTLRKAGYHSALAGVQHVIAHNRISEIGYDEVLGHAREAHFVAGRFLRNAPKQPFFLSVGFVPTHRKYPEPHPDDNPNYCMPPAPIPDNPKTRYDMACFKAGARRLDHMMGAVLEELEQTGLADNTLVVCTTDHGIAFPYMKCNVNEHGTGVMLIMGGPGGFEGGKACDAMVSHLDVYPTLCELVGVEPPVWLEGSSMMPLIRGEADEINEEIFAEVNYHAAYEPQRSVRTHRYRYIRRFEPRTSPVLPNCDDGPTKEYWMDSGWGEQQPPEEALFDLAFDPTEVNNLADRADRKDVLEDMRARLDRWMRRTDDPLLNGPIAAPKGAKVNDVDGLSPNEPTTEVA